METEGASHARRDHVHAPDQERDRTSQINRLKMLTRTMYGRAGLELLSRRFLLAA